MFSSRDLNVPTQYVANIIKPAVTNIHGTDLNDTFEFLKQIQEIDISEYYMVSYVVCSLFTNIPLTQTIQICLNRLYRSDILAPWRYLNMCYVA